MADPLKIIRRLDAVTTDYAVFERDQVLTEQQLNSVVEYLDDQSRLTRTQLLGIGIVGGLLPVLGKAQITLSKGIGVTSDGDLLGLATDTVFDRFVEYDASAPAYEPFYDGEKRWPLLELLATNDKRDGKPLAEMAAGLEKMLVVAFMESYENDPDLCTGGDCDNRGRTAKNTQRFLLLDREIAEKIRLTAGFTTGADLAKKLPRLRVVRADLGTGADAKVDITSAELFAARYRSAASASFKALYEAVQILIKQLGDGAAFGLPNPAGWLVGLEKQLNVIPAAVGGIQYYHGHAKDLVALWNDLRAALFADDGVLCPATEAFPKHLLLGALADSTVDRTGCYPAPWLAGGMVERQRVIRLMRKFALLLNAFQLPKAQLPKITPSRGESAALDERAIPIYYQADAGLREMWNETRRQRGESEDNTGYYWTPATDLKPFVPAAVPPERPLPDPFLSDQGGNDFYRIEGFLGLKADVAEPAIEKLIRQRNLPIAVISALAHNEPKWIIRGPKFKQTSLHSMHYLLRQDVASHLKDNIAYSDLLVDRFDIAKDWMPAQTGKPTATDTVKAAKVELKLAEDTLVGTDKPLSARNYANFRTVAKDWTAPLDRAVLNIGKARTTIGDIVQTNVISPVDTLSGSKSHLWVDWLGTIIDQREVVQKERLLLSNMLNEHPGLEHAGGAVPGGTFVLVYNDAGVVIGDLMLPYWIDDNDESDFLEPVLTLPDIRARLPADLVPIKVIKPLYLDLADFKTKEILPEIKIQENYSKFFQTSLGSLGDVLKNTKTVAVATDLGGLKAATNDKYMEQMLAVIKDQQAQITGLREVAGDDRMTAATREKALEQAKVIESQLAVSVGTTVEYFAVAAPETVRFEADKATVYETVGSAINLVTDKETSSKLQANLNQTAINAGKLNTGSSALIANQVMTNAGFRIG